MNGLILIIIISSNLSHILSFTPIAQGTFIFTFYSENTCTMNSSPLPVVNAGINFCWWLDYSLYLKPTYWNASTKDLVFNTFKLGCSGLPNSYDIKIKCDGSCIDNIKNSGNYYTCVYNDIPAILRFNFQQFSDSTCTTNFNTESSLNSHYNTIRTCWDLDKYSSIKPLTWDGSKVLTVNKYSNNTCSGSNLTAVNETINCDGRCLKSLSPSYQYYNCFPSSLNLTDYYFKISNYNDSSCMTNAKLQESYFGYFSSCSQSVNRTLVPIDWNENTHIFTYKSSDVCYGKNSTINYNVKCDNSCISDPQSCNQWLICSSRLSSSSTISIGVILLIMIIALLI